MCIHPLTGNCNNNLLNRDKKIYRYMPLMYLLEMLVKKQIRFNSVLSWKDPYENYLSKHNYHKNQEKVDVRKFAESFFGICWTTAKESELMWNTYRSKYDKEIVLKIESTAGKIVEICLKDQSGNGVNKIFYGQEIKYLSQRSMVTNLKDSYKFEDFYNVYLKYLFLKRNSYKHEQEYRFIAQIQVNEPFQSMPDYVQIPFSNCFIDKIVIDPITSDSDVAYAKKVISMVENTLNVVKSDLYSVPKIKTIKIV